MSTLVKIIILLIAGIVASGAIFYYQNHLVHQTEEDYISSDNIVTIIGRLRHEALEASWNPSFDDCVDFSPSIEVEGKIYWLENICSFRHIFDIQTAEDIEDIKIIKVTGEIVEREVDVPLKKEFNPPTGTKIFDVIIVSNLEIVE